MPLSYATSYSTGETSLHISERPWPLRHAQTILNLLGQPQAWFKIQRAASLSCSLYFFQLL